MWRSTRGYTIQEPSGATEKPDQPWSGSCARWTGCEDPKARKTTEGSLCSAHSSRKYKPPDPTSGSAQSSPPARPLRGSRAAVLFLPPDARHSRAGEVHGASLGRLYRRIPAVVRDSGRAAVGQAQSPDLPGTRAPRGEVDRLLVARPGRGHGAQSAGPAVSRSGTPPVASTIQRSARVSRLAEKTRRRPSGDQRGVSMRAPSKDVSFVAVPPSRPVTQTSGLPDRVETNATRLPSGETEGSKFHSSFDSVRRIAAPAPAPGRTGTRQRLTS